MAKLVVLFSFIGTLLWATTAMNLASGTCGLRKLSGRQGRVKGGQEAYPGQFPWSASIKILHDGHFCMGSIISEEYVLTAAHCFDGKAADMFTVTVGGHNLTDAEPGQVTVKPTEKIVHPSYRPGKFEDDIALLKLDTTLAWSDLVQPVCLPTTIAKKLTGRAGIMAGWGYTDEWRKGGKRSETLQWTELPILSRETCQSWFTEAKKRTKITEQKLCAGFKAGGKDACQADSGGALIVEVGQQYQVVGVVSAGFGCGEPGLPGIYTNVAKYTKWIVGEIGDRTTS